jgi:hypothetical protein
MSRDALEQRFEPALGSADVVVHEDDQRRPRLPYARVARRVQATRLAVAHHAHAHALGHLRAGVGGSVVHHEELVPGPRALAAERVERHLEVRLPAARGHHHRDRRRVHRWIA